MYLFNNVYKNNMHNIILKKYMNIRIFNENNIYIYIYIYNQFLISPTLLTAAILFSILLFRKKTK
jgi:hypothetical protein